MYISISKIDGNQKENVIFSIQVNASDNVFSFNELDGTKFNIGGDEYFLFGEFLNDSKKGFISLKKNDQAFARALLTLDPTFLFTIKLDETNWLELNLNLEG